MKKILFILHLPPPVHGSSVIGLQIKESKIIKVDYDCHYINLGTSKSINEIGSYSIGKILRYISILFQVINELIKHPPSLCYFAITVKGIGFYKDALVILLIKLFKVKLVYHLHNKGVSTRQNKLFDNFLYKKIFNNAEIILLSKYLYPDVQKYVPENHIHYCPNGLPDIRFKTQNKDHEILNNNHPVGTNEVEILFLSNLIESKGVFVLLEACKNTTQ